MNQNQMTNFREGIKKLSQMSDCCAKSDLCGYCHDELEPTDTVEADHDGHPYHAGECYATAMQADAELLGDEDPGHVGVSCG